MDRAARSRWLGRSVVALLVLSLVANAALVALVRHFYGRELLVRQDPLGRQFYPAGSPIPREPGTRTLLLYGDSRAADWGRPALAGFRVDNRGIGGQSSAQIVARADRDLFALEPDVVVLELCTNDLKAVSLYPGDEATIVARCKDNLNELVRRARERGIELVLCTVFALGEVPLYRRLVDLTPAMEHAILAVNAHIRSLAASGVVILDADLVLNGEGGRMRSEFARDALHVTPAGYAALTPRLAETLRRLQGG